MVSATRIECASALRAFAPAIHVLGDTQNMLALSAKHRALISSRARPDIRFMRLACIVTTNARVKLLAAKMLDGDDVECGVPMGALR